MYFAHIPKTAGTSLVSVLERAFAQTEIAAPRRWEEFADFDFARCNDYRLWRGHFGAHGLEALLTRPCVKVTMLRDPVQLAWSRYRYILSDSSTRLHAQVQAQCATFQAFLDLPNARVLLSNPQCRSLSFRLNKSVTRAALIGALQKEDPDAWIKSVQLELSAADQFEAALELLEAMPWFGITEQFALSVQALEKYLGLTPSDSPHLLRGERGDPQQVTDKARQRVRELAPFDHDLYEISVRHLKNRVLY